MPEAGAGEWDSQEMSGIQKPFGWRAAFVVSSFDVLNDFGHKWTIGHRLGWRAMERRRERERELFTIYNIV